MQVSQLQKEGKAAHARTAFLEQVDLRNSGAARSNKVSVTLGFQELPQL